MQRFSLLHCISGYPTPIDQCNLKLSIPEKIDKDFKIGWSDHSVNNGVINRAINKWSFNYWIPSRLDGEGDEYKTGIVGF